MSSGALTQLASHPESSYGAVGTAPAFQILNYTSGGPKLSKDIFESAVIRGDRQKSAVRHGAKKVDLDIGIEFQYGGFDVELEALLGGTWTNNVLKAGTTRRSFSVEQLISDMDAGAKKYLRALGTEWDKLSLKCPTNGMITGSLAGIAQDLDPQTAAVASSTYGAASTNPPFDAFTGTISNGTTALADITGIDINLENGLQRRNVWNSPLTLRPSIGNLKITGQLSAWFDNTTLYDLFVAETETRILLTLVDKIGNTLALDLPSLKFTSGEHNVGGPGAIPITLNFEAYYNSSAASNIVITRTPDT